ncbi:hypothetical protein P3X46_012276, partial [Hevea brasiliensis]
RYRYAHISDIIVAMIKEAAPNSPLERSEVIRAVIVRTCKELKHDNGMIIRYDDNAAVGGQLTKAIGAVVKLIVKKGKSATLKLPSGEVHLISKNYSATVKQVGNIR